MRDTHGSSSQSVLSDHNLDPYLAGAGTDSAQKGDIDGAAIISHIRSGLDVFLESLKEVLIRKGGMTSADEIKAAERYTRFNRMGPLLVAEMAVAYANGEEERLAKSVAAWVGSIAAAAGTGVGVALMGATAPGWIMALSGVLASGVVGAWVSDRNLVEALRRELESAGDFMAEAGVYADATLLDGMLKLTAGLTQSPHAVAALLSDLVSAFSLERVQRRLAMQTYDRMRLVVNEAERLMSPIVLDLDGAGINTQGIAAGVQFDYAGQGRLWRTGWVGPDDGLLVLDLNGNGRIDNGGELFGNFTVLPDGERAEHGFAALAVHDANGDGYIDRGDPVWTLLQIWRDANQDGVSQPDELHALGDFGIERIALDFQESDHVDDHGNAHRQIGRFQRADGRSAEATDVWFVVAPSLQEASESDSIPESLAQLPDLPGSGTVPNLRRAMMLDTTGRLQVIVEGFMQESDPRTRDGMIEPLLFEWAGVTEVAPGSRGPNVDARRLEAIERFLDHEFRQQGVWGREPGALAGRDVERAFIGLSRATQIGLQMSVHLVDLPARVTGQVDAQGRLHFDFSGVEEWLGGVAAFRDLDTILYTLDMEFLLQEALGPLGWNPRMFLADRIAENLQSDPGFREHLRQEMNAASDADRARFSEKPGWSPFADLFIVSQPGPGWNTPTGPANDLVIARPNETVVTRHGHNVLFSADGARLLGQSGNDTYYFFRGAGMAEIEHHDQEGSLSRIRFGPGITPLDVIVLREQHDLRIRVGDEGFLVKGWFSGPEFRITNLEFADQGSVPWAALKNRPVIDWFDSFRQNFGAVDWSPAQDAVLSLADSQSGSSILRGLAQNNVLVGSDSRRIRLYGGDGHDVLVPGPGDLVHAGKGDNVLVTADRAILHGGAGNDLYFLGRGAGIAEIRHRSLQPASNSALMFGSGINPGNVLLQRDGMDLHVRVGNDGVLLRHWFSGAGQRLKSFKFADGSEYPIENDLSGGHAQEHWQMPFVSAWMRQDTLLLATDVGSVTTGGGSQPDLAVDESRDSIRAPLAVQQLVHAVTRFDALGFGISGRPGVGPEWSLLAQTPIAVVSDTAL